MEYRAGADLDDLLTCYFRLDEDIHAIHADLSARDKKIAQLVKKYPHLRVLHQPDPWECTVAYICSATNNVARISKIVEKIAAKLGRPIELEREERHTFPTPEIVLEAGVEPLAKLGLGLQRHSRIIAAAERIRDGRTGAAPSVAAAGVLCRGQTATDGLLRNRAQGCRLHFTLRSGQDGSVFQ